MHISVKILASVSVMALLSACGGGAGKGSPYVSGQPTGVLKVGKPYEVMGQKYTPAYFPEYEEIGVASWYGPGFHGRATANGDKFDQHAMTAAHRTLPMPSVVEVTNLENGKKAVLTVNDRGPFSKERIIDLSKAAADKLGVISNGTARVRVKYLREESHKLIASSIKSGKLKADATTLAMLDMSADGTAAPSPDFSLVSSAYADEPAFGKSSDNAVSQRAELTPVISRDLASPTAVELGGQGEPVVITSVTTTTLAPQVVSTQDTYVESASNSAGQVDAPGRYIQVASFSQSQNAQQLAQKLAPLGRASVKTVDVSGRTWYRVRLGPLNDLSSARNTLTAVHGMGIPDAQIVQE
ncbi:MAG: septal ring lytic transglycosylase RlpA family protein [Alphaproteobacteria bacterium]|nr:septal ring lytic transglycosylase RlpA family protein [Alphaproteobacteria bacterium]